MVSIISNDDLKECFHHCLQKSKVFLPPGQASSPMSVYFEVGTCAAGSDVSAASAAALRKYVMLFLSLFDIYAHIPQSLSELDSGSIALTQWGNSNGYSCVGV